ncbi:hypothetical protein EMIT036CA2_60131 [Chryseobacterium sp. IT-36CA2]
MPSVYAELVKTIVENYLDADQNEIFILKYCSNTIIPTNL